MRTLKFSLFFLAVFLSSLLHTSAGDKIDGFAKLPPGDTLEVQYASSGCFHQFTCELRFTRTNAAVRVERLDLGVERPKLELVDTNLAGLDALLKFYRSNPGGGCTTRDTITISQIRGGKVIATEKFNDASCEVGKVKDVQTISSLTGLLAARAREEMKKTSSDKSDKPRP